MKLKKCFICLIILLIFTFINCITVYAYQYLRGDANGNSVVDSEDLTILAKHVANISTVSDSMLLKNSDVDENEKVDSADLTMLAKYVAKIIDFDGQYIKFTGIKNADGEEFERGSITNKRIDLYESDKNISLYFSFNGSIHLTCADSSIITLTGNVITSVNKCGSTTIEAYSYDENNNQSEKIIINVYVNDIANVAFNVSSKSNDYGNILSDQYNTTLMAMQQPEIFYADSLSSTNATNKDNIENGLKESDLKYVMYAYGWPYTFANQNFGINADAIFHFRAASIKGPWYVYAYDPDDMSKTKWVQYSYIGTNYWYPVLANTTSGASSIEGYSMYMSGSYGDPSCVYSNGKIYMAFSTTGTTGGNTHSDDGTNMVICAATTTNGVDFNFNSKPIIQDSYLCSQRPSIMYDEGKWKIWFDYGMIDGVGNNVAYIEKACAIDDFSNLAFNFESSDIVNNYAISVDTSQTKYIHHMPNLDVIKIDGIYHAFSSYEGRLMSGDNYRAMKYNYSWSAYYLAEFTSTDGRDFKFKRWINSNDESEVAVLPSPFLDKDNNIYLSYGVIVGDATTDSESKIAEDLAHYMTGESDESLRTCFRGKKIEFISIDE